MMNFMRKFWNDEEGQGLTEYALIVALIAVALIAILIAFRNQIATVFNTAKEKLSTATNDATPVVPET